MSSRNSNLTAAANGTARSALLVQVSFKVVPEVAQRLDERAAQTGLSRHGVARMLVEDALARSDAQLVSLVSDLSQSFDDIRRTLAASTNETACSTSRLDALDEDYQSLRQEIAELQTATVEFRRSVATGILGILVQGGQPHERAEEFVRNSFNLPK